MKRERKRIPFPLYISLSNGQCPKFGLQMILSNTHFLLLYRKIILIFKKMMLLLFLNWASSGGYAIVPLSSVKILHTQCDSNLIQRTIWNLSFNFWISYVIVNYFIEWITHLDIFCIKLYYIVIYLGLCILMRPCTMYIISLNLSSLILINNYLLTEFFLMILF